MIKYTEIKHALEARKSIINGVNAVIDTIKTTLGPNPLTVLTDIKGKARISDDGVTIASGIVLDDPHANSAAQTIVEIAKKTREIAGDGTTTSMVLAGAIFNEAMERIKIGDHPAKLRKEIEENCLKVIEELKNTAKPVKTLEEVKNVAKVASLDEKLGDIIGEMAFEVGIDGFIGIEESLKYKHEWEIIDGMRQDGTTASPVFLNNTEKKEVTFCDCPVLVMNGKLERFNDLNYIINVFRNVLNTNNAILIASGYSNEIVGEIVRIFLTNKIVILPVKAPSLVDTQFEDIAVFTGGKYFDLDKVKFSEDGLSGTDDSPAHKEDWGKIKHFRVNRDFFDIICDTEANAEPIRCRIEMLKEQQKLESDETIKNKIKKRIGSMSAGMGLLKVGAVTEIERNKLFRKIENAKRSAQAAMELGVVKGGGQALKDIGEKFPENILTKALKAPYNQQLFNAGVKEIEIGDNVVDPVKVEITALENACSAIKELITVYSTVAWHNTSLEQEVRDILNDEEEFTKNQTEIN